MRKKPGGGGEFVLSFQMQFKTPVEKAEASKLEAAIKTKFKGNMR